MVAIPVGAALIRPPIAAVVVSGPLLREARLVLPPALIPALKGLVKSLILVLIAAQQTTKELLGVGHLRRGGRHGSQS